MTTTNKTTNSSSTKATSMTAARREEGGPASAYLDVEPGDVVVFDRGALMVVAEVEAKIQHHVTCEATLVFADGTRERFGGTVRRLPAVAADEWKQTTEQRDARRGWSPYDAKVPASKRGN